MSCQCQQTDIVRFFLLFEQYGVKILIISFSDTQYSEQKVNLLCYVMICYVMSCHVMSCHVMLCYVMLCYVMLCYVMLCYVMLCYVMLCYVILCYVIYVMYKSVWRKPFQKNNSWSAPSFRSYHVRSLCFLDIKGNHTRNVSSFNCYSKYLWLNSVRNLFTLTGGNWQKWKKSIPDMSLP